MSVAPTPTQWLGIAQRLSESMIQVDDEAHRLCVLKALVRRLGVDAYPALIKLLIIVSESTDTQVRARLAQTLGYAAQCGDLPKGELNAWGLSRYVANEIAAQPVDAGSLMRHYWAGSATRGLGPIEYLTVWHSQKTQRPYLSDNVYLDSLGKIIALINADSQAAKRYADAILLDLETRPEGAFTRQTRLRLSSLATTWLGGAAPLDIAQAGFEASLSPGGFVGS